MKNLRKTREEKGVTQKKIASYLKVTPSSYSKYERGERNPDPQTLMKISEFLDVSIDYLLGNTDVYRSLANTRSYVSKKVNSKHFDFFESLNDDEKKMIVEFVDTIRRYNQR